MKIFRTKKIKRSESTEVSSKNSEKIHEKKTSKKSIQLLMRDSKLVQKLKSTKSKKEKKVKSKSIGARSRRTMYHRFMSKNLMLNLKRRKNNQFYTQKTMKTMKNTSLVTRKNSSLNNSLTKNRFFPNSRVSSRPNLRAHKLKFNRQKNHKKNFSESFFFINDFQ